MEKFNNLILNDDGHHIKLIIEEYFVKIFTISALWAVGISQCGEA